MEDVNVRILNLDALAKHIEELIHKPCKIASFSGFIETPKKVLLILK